MRAPYVNAKVEAGIFIALMLLMTSPCIAQYWEYGQPNRRQISVGGEAEIKVAPNQVVIMLIAESMDSILTKSKSKNDSVIKGFTDAALKSGVDAGDVQTDFINIEPTITKINDKNLFLGYSIQRRLIITLKDISKFNELYSNLIIAGATKVEDVQFQTTELRKYRDEARVAAIKAASEKASLLAGELGAKAGKPLGIQERSNDWWGWYGGWGGHYGSRAPMSSQNSISPQSAEDLPVAIGKISIKATVNVTFELE
jgi:uncharacterized protein